MTKKMIIVFILIGSLVLASCSNKNDVLIMEESVRINYDDNALLKDVLSETYSIKDLREFFVLGEINKYMNKNAPPISYEEVNNVFPVEIVRSKNYSVYRVSEGGYYYVFWVSSIDSSGVNNGYYVYYSLYLTSAFEERNYDDHITVNKSTLHDLYSIDPYFYLNNHMSFDIYAYSYVNNEEVMKFTCSPECSDTDYLNMVIISMCREPMSQTTSIFKDIMECDLP